MELGGRIPVTVALAETLTPLKRISVWPRFPVSYEINTWVWLSQLSQKYRKGINLASVPSTEWDAIAAYGIDAVWLMGVWERSPAGEAIANQHGNSLGDFRRTLPDFRFEDNVGSPYCVRRYVVDKHLGGPEGLAVARQELTKRNINLILDFVPNHVTPDHSWVAENPEYFNQGNADDLRNDSSSYMEALGRVFARGRDPHFPAWPDVLQLNAFEPALRRALTDTASSIAQLIENHDEPGAAVTFSPAKQRAVALTMATLPGMKLFQHGQFDGRKVRLPVLLSRRPDEPVGQDLEEFYKKLLRVINRPIFHEGHWSLCERTGWPDNATFQNVVAWNWVKDDERYLVAVNLSESTVQCRVQVRWAGARGGNWQLIDELSNSTYERDADEMLWQGLYVELGPWNYHFFRCLRTNTM
jgi:hypothetical protein